MLSDWVFFVVMFYDENTNDQIWIITIVVMFSLQKCLKCKNTLLLKSTYPKQEMDGTKVYDENVNVVLFTAGKSTRWNTARTRCMRRDDTVVYCKNHKNILTSNSYLRYLNKNNQVCTETKWQNYGNWLWIKKTPVIQVSWLSNMILVYAELISWWFKQNVHLMFFANRYRTSFV